MKLTVLIQNLKLIWFYIDKNILSLTYLFMFVLWKASAVSSPSLISLKVQFYFKRNVLRKTFLITWSIPKFQTHLQNPKLSFVELNMLVFPIFSHMVVAGGNKWTWEMAAGPQSVWLALMFTLKTVVGNYRFLHFKHCNERS